MNYFVPALMLAGSAIFAWNAWLGFRRGKLYFFEFWADNQVQRTRDALLFLIAFYGSILISIATLVIGVGLLIRK